MDSMLWHEVCQEVCPSIWRSLTSLAKKVGWRGHSCPRTACISDTPDRLYSVSELPVLLLGLESPADPEHVAIWMAKVHLADVPRHIGGRKRDLQPDGDAVLVHLVHVVHPDRHPDALVALFVSVLLKRGGVRAAAAASLRPLTPWHPNKERCRPPYPIPPRQTSEAFPSPTISSIPTSQTTRPCWQCRPRLILESDL